MKLTILIFLLGLGVSSLGVYGQDIRLKGSVVDGESLEPLPGAHVFTHFENGTITDIDGNFHLEVQIGDTLRFSMLGYDSIALIISDTASFQSIIVSMKEKEIELKEVEVRDIYQANTVLENSTKEIYRVPGAHYPENPEGKNYRLGVGRAILSPATAIYRLTSKTYKEEKRNHVELARRQTEIEDYERAKEVFYEALEVLGENFDEYYMLDFFLFSGLTVSEVADLPSYDLLEMLPGALQAYYEHLENLADH